jgi:hypothetical protein
VRRIPFADPTVVVTLVAIVVVTGVLATRGLVIGLTGTAGALAVAAIPVEAL